MGDDELRLEPIDEATELQRKIIREAPLSPVFDPPKEEPQARFQFSILHMLCVTGVVGIVAALFQWFSPNVIAGVFGLVTFLALVAVTLLGNNKPILQIVWLGLGLIYVVVAMIALVNSCYRG